MDWRLARESRFLLRLAIPLSLTTFAQLATTTTVRTTTVTRIKRRFISLSREDQIRLSLVRPTSNRLTGVSRPTLRGSQHNAKRAPPKMSGKFLVHSHFWEWWVVTMIDLGRSAPLQRAAVLGYADT